MNSGEARIFSAGFSATAKLLAEPFPHRSAHQSSPLDSGWQVEMDEVPSAVILKGVRNRKILW
jgi:hypothetical protein